MEVVAIEEGIEASVMQFALGDYGNVEAFAGLEEVVVFEALDDFEGVDSFEVFEVFDVLEVLVKLEELEELEESAEDVSVVFQTLEVVDYSILESLWS